MSALYRFESDMDFPYELIKNEICESVNSPVRTTMKDEDEEVLVESQTYVLYSAVQSHSMFEEQRICYVSGMNMLNTTWKYLVKLQAEDCERYIRVELVHLEVCDAVYYVLPVSYQS